MCVVALKEKRKKSFEKKKKVTLSIHFLAMEEQDVEIVEGEPIDWHTILADTYGVQAPSDWEKAVFFIKRTQHLLDQSLGEPPVFGVVVEKMQCPILGVEFKNDVGVLLDDSMEPVSVDFVQLCLEQATNSVMNNEGDDAVALSAINKIKNPYTNEPIKRILLIKAAIAIKA
jgi:hypothetical protein